jgi:twitching motility two-component system response regulator PilG
LPAWDAPSSGKTNSNGSGAGGKAGRPGKFLSHFSLKYGSIKALKFGATSRAQKKPGQGRTEPTLNKGRYKVNDGLPLSGVKVVLIDDSNTIRRSGEIFLSQAGCQVVLAEDGFEGLSRVVDTKPDVVFVDIMMPRLDGYQTCALIKNNPEFRNTPVVMLTSKDSLFDRARGQLVGSNQYLTKPFSKKSLIDAVIAQMQSKKGE